MKNFTLTSILLVVLLLVASVSFGQVKPPPSNDGSSDRIAVTDIKVFPNPAAEYIHLDLSKNIVVKEGIHISIQSINGQILIYEYISESEIGFENKSINISSLPPGSYVVNINLDRTPVQKRFVKVK